MNVSLVIPVFNEEESLEELYNEIGTALSHRYELEILFVNDGSTDSSETVLKQIAESDPRVKVVTLFRNYGKAAALSAGFELSQSEVVVTLDSDLQDDPSEIIDMVKQLDDGWDLVSGWKKVRLDPPGKRFSSKIFNSVLRRVTGLQIHDFNCGLKVYRSEVVKGIDIYGGLHRYIPALAKYKGFRVTEKEVHHRTRKHGVTKYGRARYFHGFFDLLSVMFLERYTQRPLHFFGMIGALTGAAGVAISVYLTIGWLRGIWIGNRPLFFLGILLIIVGFQFFSLGLIAELVTQSRHKYKQTVKDIYSPIK